MTVGYRQGFNHDFGGIYVFTGKGGTGKSTLSVILADILVQKGLHPLLIDADPTMAHLALMMGVDVENAPTLEKIRRNIIDKAALGTPEERIEFAEKVDALISDAVINLGDISVLILGQPEIAGCFCPANTFLKNVMAEILSDYKAVIIDCEAGLEQIHRSVIERADYILIIAEPSVRSLQTARAILNAACRFIEFKTASVVINKMDKNKNGSEMELLRTAEFLGLTIAGFLPYNTDLISIEMKLPARINRSGPFKDKMVFKDTIEHNTAIKNDFSRKKLKMPEELIHEMERIVLRLITGKDDLVF